MADELISREALFEQETFLRDEDGFEYSCVLSSDIRRIPSVNAIVLPCEVGDTVWYADEDINRVLMGYISEYQLLSDGAIYFEFTNVESDIEWVSVELLVDEFGKTVFLTREEAEKALEGREDNG